MDKRYLIVFALAVLAAIGFFTYKEKKKEKELEAHNLQQYNRIIEVAKSSSVAGLGQMGLALNKYKEERGSYPDTLSALYPDYIPVKAFIDDIQWQYEPEEDDFYLAKTIRNRENKVVTAAIGSDLMPIGETTVASASIDETQEQPVDTIGETTVASASIDETQEQPVDSVVESTTEEEPEVSITLASYTNSKPVTEVIPPEISPINPRKLDSESHALPKPLKTRRSPLLGLEPVSTKRLNQKEQYLQRVQGNLLVWKNDDGSLGFGNVQYPSSEKMTIYDNEEWVQVRQRKADTQIEFAAWKPQVERPIQGNFLVWKNDDGSLGFGNVQYPSSEKMTIYDNQEWVQIQQQSPDMQITPAIWEHQKKETDYLDRLIAARSDNFLVWKDSRGAICFGNVQYPHNENVQIHVDGRWQPVNN